MGDKWKDKGECPTLFDSVLDALHINPFPKEHLVENAQTGEHKTIIVGSGQTVGEAVSKGQWKK